MILQTWRFAERFRRRDILRAEFQHQVRQRWRPALSAPIQRNLAIHHVGDIPAFGKKLHDFMTCAGQFRPARSGSRVLFEATYFLAVEGEVHLAQPVLGGAADRKVPAVEPHFLAALNQGLPPNGNQCLFQIHLPTLCEPAVTPSGRVDYPRVAPSMLLSRRRDFPEASSWANQRFISRARYSMPRGSC